MQEASEAHSQHDLFLNASTYSIPDSYSPHSSTFVDQMRTPQWSLFEFVPAPVAHALSRFWEHS